MTFPVILKGIGGEVQPAPLPWWFWVILFVMLAVILLWMWYQGRSGAALTTNGGHIGERIAQVIPDDLKLIEGIGPKINAVLQAAGIQTFSDLADSPAETLRKVLLDAGMRLADPTSWPQQAAFARDGKLEELRALQERLTAGRR